jgi:hypothetical protein
MKTKGLSFAHFFVAHSISATALAYILSWIFGGLSPFIASVSLVFSFFRARRFTRAMRNSLEWRAPGGVRPWAWTELVILTFVLFASWKHFAWLMPAVPTGGTPAVTTLSLTNYGDLPLHLNFIRSLAAGTDFLPINPIFALEKLRYPFGANLYSAIWECLGFHTLGHLFLTGMAMTGATLILLRELGGAWAMAAFFLAGGAVAGVAEQDWKSLFLSVWITQRGMLWALPIGLMLLMDLRSHLSERSRLPQRAVSGLGRMWGLLPFFHAHAFFAVSLLLFFLVRNDFGRPFNKTRSADFLKRFFLHNRALYWALIPAAFFVYYLTDGLQRVSVVRVKSLWMLPHESTSSMIWNWLWINFGNSFGALFLVILGLWLNERLMAQKLGTSDTEVGKTDLSKAGVGGIGDTWLQELLLYALFFIAGLFIMLAPWEWDNIKILIWPWILGFGLVGRRLSARLEARTNWLWQIIFVFGLVVAFFPGVQIIAESWKDPQNKSAVVWRLDQLAQAEAVLMKISHKAIFAAAPSPNHPLAYFGKIRVMGYPGHLWSHGIDYSKTEIQLDEFMNGSPNWIESAKALKLTHVYWGPEEKLKWGKNARIWQSRLALVARSGEHEVYEFKESK